MVEVIFLGTSNAFGSDGRLNSSYIIQGSSTILMDCGPATLSGLKRNGFKVSDIEAILLSHIHPDHYLGLPQIVLEDYYVVKRPDQIPLYCPPGTKEKINEIAQVMYNEEIGAHVNVLFDFIEFEHGESRDIPSGSVTSLEANHSGNARMMFIKIDNATIGYTGDTSYHESSFAELLKAQVLITEASSAGFSVPDHMTIEDVFALPVPDGCRVYLSHLGKSVINKKDDIKPPFYLSMDNMKISI